MKIRRFEEKDAKKVSELIIDTLRRTNIKDSARVSIILCKLIDKSSKSNTLLFYLHKNFYTPYSADSIENHVNNFQPENVLKRASWTHFYVAQEKGNIIGCGAIAPYWDKLDESSLFTIFISPEYQRKGIGRKIIETLEKDEYFLRAKRIEVPASITAIPFYKKMGYSYKNGVNKADNEGIVRMEKFR